MTNQRYPSEFIEYLVEHIKDHPENDQIPSLSALSESLGISIARLREQLEAAKTLGLVEVRPRTGIKCQPYSFFQPVWRSLSYAIELDQRNFDLFSELRKQVELAFWHKAVASLTPDDKAQLRDLIEQASSKIQGNPILVPHPEHRALHMLIFKNLDNPFVLGILEAYWDAYEAIGLSVFTDLRYLQDVWEYHRVMVESICQGDFERGYRALADHADLLRHRPGVQRGTPQ